MRILTVGSIRGAPGVTTTAQLLAGGIDDSVHVEADPEGGVMAVRYGLEREPGLTTLASENPEDIDRWRSHVQSAGGVPVLVGPDAPEASESLWRTAGRRLASILRRSSGSAAVVDVGRLSPASPLLRDSDLLIVEVRPVAEHLVGLSHRLPELRQIMGPARVAVVLAGTGPYRARDVGSALGIDVIGELPDDTRAAEQLLRGGRSPGAFARTRLARAAAALSHAISISLDTPEEIATR